jgi:ABC-type spermidine/putrescine transport system permease subunit I
MPLTPALVFLLLFMVVPPFLVFIQSLHPTKLLGRDVGSIGSANYLYLAQRSVYVEAFARTFRLALYAVVGAVLLGYPTALILRRLHERLGTHWCSVSASPSSPGRWLSSSAGCCCCRRRGP